MEYLLRHGCNKSSIDCTAAYARYLGIVGYLLLLTPSLSMTHEALTSRSSSLNTKELALEIGGELDNSRCFLCAEDVADATRTSKTSVDLGLLLLWNGRKGTAHRGRDFRVVTQCLNAS